MRQAFHILIGVFILTVCGCQDSLAPVIDDLSDIETDDPVIPDDTIVLPEPYDTMRVKPIHTLSPRSRNDLFLGKYCGPCFLNISELT